MTTAQPNDIPSRLLALLTAIAPDIDPATVESGLDFRDQFDFDSMDLLHFATAISKEFGIEVAERDYVQLSGLDKASALVRARLSAGGEQPPR